MVVAQMLEKRQEVGSHVKDDKSAEVQEAGDESCVQGENIISPPLPLQLDDVKLGIKSRWVSYPDNDIISAMLISIFSH